MATRTITEDFTTVGTTSWKVPAGVTSVTLDMIGGGHAGGAGGGYWDNYSWYNTWGSGGNAGSRVQTTVSVTPGDTITITVGAGGQASSFGSLASAAAGSGYAGNTSGANGIAVDRGGFYSSNIVAGTGTAYYYRPSDPQVGAPGGTGWGAGGGAGYGANPYGSGYAGGAGAQGCVRVTWASQDFGGEGILGKVEFKNPGSYSWTVPAATSYIIVEITGAGGGGSGGSCAQGCSSGAAGIGGKRGQYKALALAVSPGDTFNITVGSKGLGGAAAVYQWYSNPNGSKTPGNGTDGSSSSFGNDTIGVTTCAGGAGGVWYDSCLYDGQTGQFGGLDDPDAPQGATPAERVQNGYGDRQYSYPGGIDGGADSGEAGKLGSWIGGHGGAGGAYRGAGGGGGGAGAQDSNGYTGQGGYGGNGTNGYVRIIWTGWDVTRPAYTGRLKVKTSAGNTEIGLASPSDTGLRTNIVRIYDNGVKAVDLVPVDHRDATGIRIQTHKGKWAFRKYG